MEHDLFAISSFTRSPYTLNKNSCLQHEPPLLRTQSPRVVDLGSGDFFLLRE